MSAILAPVVQKLKRYPPDRSLSSGLGIGETNWTIHWICWIAYDSSFEHATTARIGLLLTVADVSTACTVVIFRQTLVVLLGRCASYFSM